MISEGKSVVIACEVLREEIERVKPPDCRVVYVRQSLHRTPQVLASAVQQEIDALEPEGATTVLMAYGLCSNGIVGVKATRGEIIVPRVHDCIGILLGSFERYVEEQKKAPGTYYLSPGWVRERKDPLGILEEYRSYLSGEDAEWCIGQELKNYRRIALICMEETVPESIRIRARENAKYFAMSYEEIRGDDRLLQKLFRMERTGEFVIVPPGGSIGSEPFTSLPPGDGTAIMLAPQRSQLRSIRK